MSSIKFLDTTGTQALINEIKTRLATKTTQYSSMPEPTASDINRIVQFIGTTSSGYTQGDFYKGTAGEPIEVEAYEESSYGVTGAVEVVADDADPFDPETQVKISDVTDDIPTVEVGDYVKKTTSSVPTYAWTKITYNADEIVQLISTAGHFVLVNELPTTNIKTNVIYLVPKRISLSGYVATDNTFYVVNGATYDHYDEDGVKLDDTVDAAAVTAAIEAGTYTAATRSVLNPDINNIKDEYINLDGTTAGWEKIGETKIDLSDYVQFTDLVAITSSELAAMWEA